MQLGGQGLCGWENEDHVRVMSKSSWLNMSSWAACRTKQPERPCETAVPGRLSVLASLILLSATVEQHLESSK